jgi:uncharacterized protein YdgA (DUF945 family)
MKKTGIIIVVLLALLLLLPGVFGLFTGSQVNQRVSEINEAGMLDIQIREYRRGWFSSSARLLVRAPQSATPFAMDAAPTDPAEVALAGVYALLAEPVAVRVTIAHGPLPRSRGMHFGTSAIHATTDADDTRIAARLAALDLASLFDFHARTSFGGAVDFNAVIPSVNTTWSGALVRFSGATSQGRARGADLKWDLRFDELDVDFGFGRVELGGVHFQGDNTLISRYLILGPADMRIDRIAMSVPMLGPDAAFRVRQLRLYGANTPDAQHRLLDSELGIAFDSMTLGEDVRVTDAELQMQLANLHLASWEKLLAESQQVATGASPEAVMLTRIQPLMRELLAEGPQLAVAPLSFVLNGDQVLLNLRLAVIGERIPDNLMAGMEDPLSMFDMIDLEADATVAKQLLEELAANVARTQILNAQAAGRPVNDDEIEAMAAAQANLILLVLSAQGLITDAGENYSATISIRQGTLTVNGTELPLSLLEAALP